MSNAPSAEQLQWVLQIVGGEAVVDVTGLRDGGAPWRIRYSTPGGGGLAVLRVGGPDDALTQGREALGMQLADRQGIPVPNVLGARLDDEASLLLIEHVDGSSAQPGEADPARLRALGALAARIATVNPGDADLPRVDHPIPREDFRALRAQADPQPLLQAAERLVADSVPDEAAVFVHGDLWSGNTLWRDDELVAVLDWDCAGIGPAGVDLGSLRCDAAMRYGLEASDEVLAGWEDEAAQPAQNVAYWDVVAALSTPPGIDWFAPAIAGMTHRPDLTVDVLRERRDAFLERGLAQLRR